jgi:hypothetical protein
MCDEMQTLDEQTFIDRINQVLSAPADAPVVGALPDRVLSYKLKD